MGNSFFTAIEDAAPDKTGREAALAFPTFSGPFARTLDRLDRLAASSLSLLLLGETGTGKEVIARAVHARSGRPGPFIAVNCGALPKELVESSLFGHVRGSFSGAVRDEVGFVRAANAGTLFLDEVGDLPLAAQSALLRVLQESEVNPIGSNQPVRVDVRILAATNRPLDRMIEESVFRGDLYARLAGFIAKLPPLRERKADLGQLAAAWIADGRLPEVRFRREAIERLLEHEWPFNVRELLQALQARCAPRARRRRARERFARAESERSWCVNLRVNAGARCLPRTRLSATISRAGSPSRAATSARSRATWEKPGSRSSGG